MACSSRSGAAGKQASSSNGMRRRRIKTAMVLLVQNGSGKAHNVVHEDVKR
jgi:hypothetical protein